MNGNCPTSVISVTQNAFLFASQSSTLQFVPFESVLNLEQKIVSRVLSHVFLETSGRSGGN